MGRHCNDTKVKSLAHQQTARLPPASHPEGSTWCLDHPILPGSNREERIPCLKVQREETVALAIVFQRCAIWAGASPNVFCGVVQELHECLVPMVEEDDLFNIETEI